MRRSESLHKNQIRWHFFWRCKRATVESAVATQVRINRDLRLTRIRSSVIKKCQRISFLCKGIRARIAYIPSHRGRYHWVDYRNQSSTVRKSESRASTTSCVSTNMEET